MTATVTEKHKSGLKLMAVKQACLFKTPQVRFHAVILTKRIKKLPKMHHKSFLVTQPYKNKKRKSSYYLLCKTPFNPLGPKEVW